MKFREKHDLSKAVDKKDKATATMDFSEPEPTAYPGKGPLKAEHIAHVKNLQPTMGEGIWHHRHAKSVITAHPQLDPKGDYHDGSQIEQIKVPIPVIEKPHIMKGGHTQATALVVRDRVDKKWRHGVEYLDTDHRGTRRLPSFVTSPIHNSRGEAVAAAAKEMKQHFPDDLHQHFDEVIRKHGGISKAVDRKDKQTGAIDFDAPAQPPAPKPATKPAAELYRAPGSWDGSPTKHKRNEELTHDEIADMGSGEFHHRFVVPRNREHGQLNDHGVYQEGVEEVEIPLPKGLPTGTAFGSHAKVRVVQDKHDGKWRHGMDGWHHNGGRSSAPSLDYFHNPHNPGFDTREAALSHGAKQLRSLFANPADYTENTKHLHKDTVQAIDHFISNPPSKSSSAMAAARKTAAAAPKPTSGNLFEKGVPMGKIIIVNPVVIRKSYHDHPKLPENHAAYFDLSAGDHKVVPLHKLTPTKPPESQPKSVHTALGFMSQAAAGAKGKRGPITVHEHEGGYKVIDGNATYGAAQHSGWKSMPVKVVPAPGAEASVHKAIAIAQQIVKSQEMGMPYSPHPVQPSKPAITQTAPAPAAASNTFAAGPTTPPPAAPAYKPKGLFQDHELNAPKARQPHATLDEIFHHAHEANESLCDTLDRGKGISAARGMAVVDGTKGERVEDEAHAGKVHHPAGAVIIGGLKDKGRSEKKVRTELGNDPSQLLDVSRATVVMPRHHDLHEALEHTRHEMGKAGWTMVRAKDKYQKPQDEGYMGTLTNWQHSNGHVAEIQFNDADMQHAKGPGHKHYEVIRDQDTLRADEGGRDRTPEEEAVFQHHFKAQQEIYGAAWQKQLDKHAHLAKSLDAEGNIVKSFAHKRQAGVHSHWGKPRMQAAKHVVKPRDFNKTHYYNYRDGHPAIMEPRRSPHIYRNGKWEPLHDTMKFLQHAEQISKDEFTKMLGPSGNGS